MENASKALLMAGGILISIIVIGLLSMSYNSMKAVPRQQEENERIAAIEAFNREYLAYDKGRLYGTDLITVFRKAMSNNQKYEVLFDASKPTENEWAYNIIQIELETSSDKQITPYAVGYYWDYSTNKLISSQVSRNAQSFTANSIMNKISNINSNCQFIDMLSLNKGQTYSLEDTRPKNTKLKTFLNQQDYITLKNCTFLFEDKSPVRYAWRDSNLLASEYIVWHSGLTDFKRNYYECKEVRYSDVTGKINYMRFRQL